MVLAKSKRQPKCHLLLGALSCAPTDGASISQYRPYPYEHVPTSQGNFSDKPSVSERLGCPCKVGNCLDASVRISLILAWKSL